ncbi:MAG: hypothetical protein KatS3mg079_642 [Caloramator sp.]|nr:MAG: hypothetical protein KatS3mg079_642 [Caloramator sp.]
METKIYNVEEVAKMLRCGKTSIYELNKAKQTQMCQSWKKDSDT